MRISAFSLGFCLLLSACMKVQDTSTKALDKVETETSSSWHKIREYLDLGSKPPAKEKSRVQPRYCYGTLQDTICYPSPIPGQEDRLVAYQNSAGTGYTLAPHADHPIPKKKAAKADKAVEKLPEATAAPVALPAAPAPTSAPTATPVTAAAPLATMPEAKPEATPVPVPVTPAPAPTSAPAPVPTPAPTPAPSTGAQSSGKPEEPKKLKEITFDPSELEPKKLVPDRLQ